MLFLPYLSSAFVPTDTMPSFLRAVSQNHPITPIIETVRGLLTGTRSATAAGWRRRGQAGCWWSSFTFATWLYRGRTRS